MGEPVDVDRFERWAHAVNDRAPRVMRELADAILALVPLAREALAVRALTATHAGALGPAFAAERIECGCPEPVVAVTIDIATCVLCGFPLCGTTGAVEAHAEAQRASGR